MFDLSETVRQMLGLEEDQVVELSGDNEKYEVNKFRGKITRIQSDYKNMQFVGRAGKHEYAASRIFDL